MNKLNTKYNRAILFFLSFSLSYIGIYYFFFDINKKDLYLLLTYFIFLMLVMWKLTIPLLSLQRDLFKYLTSKIAKLELNKFNKSETIYHYRNISTLFFLSLILLALSIIGTIYGEEVLPFSDIVKDFTFTGTKYFPILLLFFYILPFYSQIRFLITEEKVKKFSAFFCLLISFVVHAIILLMYVTLNFIFLFMIAVMIFGISG